MESNWTNATAAAADASASSSGQFTFVLYRLAVPVLFSVVTLSGLIGNGLVIYVIVSRERMQTVTNLLLLNLAVADLAFVVVVPPFTAYQMAVEWWPFGDVACRLLHSSRSAPRPSVRLCVTHVSADPETHDQLTHGHGLMSVYNKRAWQWLA